MDIFEQIYRQLIMQDEISPQTQQESQELTYLRKVLNKYWDVDDDTILKIDKIINAADQKTGEKRFKKEKIEAINTIKKCFIKDIDVVEYLVDNNGKNLSQFADYVTKKGKNVSQRLHIPTEGYITADTIIEGLKERGINIDHETLSKICSIIPSKSGRGVGKGEVLCTTLLNVSQTTSGDGALNGESLVQIKGYKARLKDADNYGQWNIVADKLETLFREKREIINNKIREYNKNIKNDDDKIQEISEFPKKKKDNTCNTCKQICDWIVYNKKQLKQAIGEEEKKTMKDAFGHLFKNSGAFAQVEDLYNIFINSLFNDEKESWEEAYLTLSLTYYRIVGKWQYMILIDNPSKTGEEGIFKGLYISDSIPNIIKHIKVINWPSGKDERASAICIAYREVDEAMDQAVE